MSNVTPGNKKRLVAVSKHFRRMKNQDSLCEAPVENGSWTASALKKGHKKQDPKISGLLFMYLEVFMFVPF